MSGTLQRREGNFVFEVVDANLGSGNMVIPSTTATSDPSLQGIKVAGDAAKNALGVLVNDCVTVANRDALQYPTGPAPMSNVGIDFTIPEATSTVWERGETVVRYTAVAVPYGAKLACAAAGAVRAWVTADGADAMIGHCTAIGGVSSAGGLARAFINII